MAHDHRIGAACDIRIRGCAKRGNQRSPRQDPCKSVAQICSGHPLLQSTDREEPVQRASQISSVHFARVGRGNRQRGAESKDIAITAEAAGRHCIDGSVPNRGIAAVEPPEGVAGRGRRIDGPAIRCDDCVAPAKINELIARTECDESTTDLSVCKNFNVTAVPDGHIVVTSRYTAHDAEAINRIFKRDCAACIQSSDGVDLIDRTEGQRTQDVDEQIIGGDAAIESHCCGIGKRTHTERLARVDPTCDDATTGVQINVAIGIKITKVKRAARRDADIAAGMRFGSEAQIRDTRRTAERGQVGIAAQTGRQDVAGGYAAARADDRIIAHVDRARDKVARRFYQQILTRKQFVGGDVLAGVKPDGARRRTARQRGRHHSGSDRVSRSD